MAGILNAFSATRMPHCSWISCLYAASCRLRIDSAVPNQKPLSRARELSEVWTMEVAKAGSAARDAPPLAAASRARRDHRDTSLPRDVLRELAARHDAIEVAEG